MNATKNITLLALLLLACAVHLSGESRRYPSPPTGLPLMDEYPAETLTDHLPPKVEVLLPKQLRLQKITSPLNIDLTITSFSGKPFLMSPKDGRTPIENKALPLKAWDRLVTSEKTEIRLASSSGNEWVLGSNGLLQILKQEDGTAFPRLLKGRLRVINRNEDEPVCVETLNAILSIPTGTTDIIISAMNTLVAPREGKDVVVSTRKIKQKVAVGRYGFVTHDGTLLYSKGQ